MINKRILGHKYDKNKTKPILDKCIVYKNRFNASRGEKYVKNIIEDMELKLNYYNNMECFYATPKELEAIYKKVEEHSSYEV